VKRRCAYSLVELLVAISIIALLICLALPAIQMARESSRRAQCQNNLRQLGVALMSFESAARLLPAGRDAENDYQHSWATAVLPQLDQQALHSRYDYGNRWNSSSNAVVAQANVKVFRCPSATLKWDGKSDYGGNYGSSLTGLFPGSEKGSAWESGTFPPINVGTFGNYRNQAVRINEITDGTSHTFFVLEDADRPASAGGVWANGHNCFAHDKGRVNNRMSKEIFSRHPAGANGLLADCSVRFLTESVDPWILGALSTRAAGEAVTD
jgi:prepilin-type N-terminal cleavage/methylation domain-containing protein